jgi:hypothetical protein
MKITSWIPTQKKRNPEIIMHVGKRPVLTFNCPVLKNFKN